MKKFRLLGVGILLCLSSSIWAQQTGIKGVLVDSTDSALPSATVMLVNASDSTMEKFSISRVSGAFLIQGVDPGDYLLQVSYVGFQNISKPVRLQEGQIMDLGRIPMQQKNELLENVTIEADRIPILIKEDTIEYNAKAFATQPGATVEELLKKLPGIEVEADGTIKAQGEEVQKVLVDGKEFFGDDPQIATKNLPADAMDKVQVFDKLSDVAEFTGIDDGNRDKTINLTLKEDRKNGYFGNVKGGYGQDERYDGKFNINQFTKEQQFSVIGAANNINEQSFSIQDYINFIGGFQSLASSGGSINLNLDEGLSSALGLSNGGVRSNWSLGTNLNREFGKNTDLSVNYFFNRLENRLDKSTFRQNFNGENSFDSERELVSNSIYGLHRLNLTLKQKISENQDITARVGLRNTTNESDQDEVNNILDINGDLQNESNVQTGTEGDGLSLNSSLLYRKKFSKKGRTLTGRVTINSNSNDRFTDLNSNLTLAIPDGSGAFETSSLVQEQLESSRENLLGFQVNYTEPVLRGKLLQGTLSRQRTNHSLNKDFFDLGDDRERVFNENLSTEFDNEYVYNTGGLRLFLGSENSKIIIGVNAQQSTLKGSSPTVENILTRRFFNFLPNASWRRQFKNAGSLFINYTTSVREPSIEQLQPVVNNVDPLFLYNGNPNLNTAYAHTLRINYSLFDQFSLTSVFLNTSIAYVTDQITNQTTIDESFRQVVTPVNVDNDLTVRGSLSFSRPIRPIGTKVSIDLNTRYNRGILFVNNEENIVNRQNSTINFKLENRNKKVIDLGAGVRLSKNTTRYLTNESLNRDFLRQSIFATLNIKIAKKWNIGGEFSRENFGGDGFGGNQTFPLLEASLSRTFLKFNRGLLKVSAFDLLNRNQGIFRNSSFNFVQEERVNVLNRYFLVSFSYSLSALKK